MLTKIMYVFIAIAIITGIASIFLAEEEPSVQLDFSVENEASS